MLERNEREPLKVPKIGDIVYLPTRDSDFHHVTGGWAVVVEVEDKMVRTYEDHSSLINWNTLASRQDVLKEQFGENRAHIGF